MLGLFDFDYLFLQPGLDFGLWLVAGFGLPFSSPVMMIFIVAAGAATRHFLPDNLGENFGCVDNNACRRQRNV
jgi:hypothetical protein